MNKEKMTTFGCFEFLPNLATLIIFRYKSYQDPDGASLYAEPLVAACFLLFWTASASSARTLSVSSQPIHASVMETAYLRPDFPSLGIFWLPSLMCDSIMTLMMASSPAAIWVASSWATLGWFLWFFSELPWLGYMSVFLFSSMFGRAKTYLQSTMSLGLA